MRKKYIKQIVNQSFVYPNYEKNEYDIELNHNLNNNSVSGSVVTFSATTISSTGITINYSLNWTANGAEIFQMENSDYSYISIHMSGPNQTYFKPFRLIDNISSSTLYTGTTNFSGTTVVTPAELGISSITSGTYYYEIRFIGHRAFYPICGSISTVVPTPTPTPTATTTATPTPTPTGPTPTPTSTLTPTPTPTATSSEAELSVYAKYKDASADIQYSVNAQPPISIGTISTTGCTFYVTITGLTNGDSVEFTSPTTAAIAGDPTGPCPDTGFLCDYTSSITSGTNYAYLTVDGDTIC